MTFSDGKLWNFTCHLNQNFSFFTTCAAQRPGEWNKYCYFPLPQKNSKAKKICDTRMSMMANVRMRKKAVVQYSNMWWAKRTFIFIVCTTTIAIFFSLLFLSRWSQSEIFLSSLRFANAWKKIALQRKKDSSLRKRYNKCERGWEVKQKKTHIHTSHFHEVRSLFLTLQWQIIICDKKQSCAENKKNYRANKKLKLKHLNIV